MKRILSLLLVFCLFLPAFSFAELDEDDYSYEDIDLDEGEDDGGEDFDLSDLDEDAFAALDDEIDDSIDLNELEINPNLPENIINIMLIGVDSHKPIEKDGNGNVIRRNIVGNADTQIIVSINTDTGEIKMTSIQRDSFVAIPGSTNKHKINTAFEYGAQRAKKTVDDPDNWDNLTPGGAALVMRTVNHNFQMNISSCVVINFSGLASIIDAIGGIDIDMTKAESKGVNSYLAKAYKKPSMFTYDPTYNPKTRTSTREKLKVMDGIQHCDGIQALTYARLRSLKGQNDFNRTDRQRHLLDLLLKKVLHDTDINGLIDLISTCIDYAYSNISGSTFLNLARSILSSGITGKINGEDALFESMQIPQRGHFQYADVNGSSVLSYNIASHAEALHEFIYGSFYPAE